ncbi:M23 family metallopeptidase [Streptomyces natalensis]|uniref:Peptidase M23 n=1 Tax=Streptomyces natalensis ATCC 27448 TaxID=1240678 RepID=A0A0D7CES5_9ACTN|nr:M23 family metallopeptidase [Streptomyces natalensis]KIZ14571.1 peptidase M23 [Streptomyces natalensis ATCC 27448]
MNDRHPSGYPAYDSYGQQHSASAHLEYGDGDPLFGSLPGTYETGQHAAGAYDAAPYDTGGHAYGTGAYATGGYETGAYATGPYDGGIHGAAYDTGSYPTTAYGTATAAYDGYDPYAHTAYENAEPEQYPPYGQHGQHGGQEHYGQHEQLAHQQHEQLAHHEQHAYDTAAYDTGSYDTGPYATGAYDTAGHDATAIWSTADQALIGDIPAQPGPSPYENAAFETAAFETAAYDTAGFETATFETAAFETAAFGTVAYENAEREAGSPADPPGEPAPAPDAASVAEAMTQAMPVTTPAPAARRVVGPEAGKAVRGRGRRRTAKRSALLTVAVPSVAAMGVCAAAAATVTGFVGDDGKDDKTTQAADDTGSVTVKAAAANKKLDSQLAGLSADARDFGDRANRTQERLDLKQRQALERKRAAAEAARKEALRPKFVLPVTEHGLSALFGQAGVNWMSVHTGIDFPVSYGTPVMSVTDGTVRTQWNSAYGNMAIVTAPDGTETWYCHLSSAKIRSGSVKAGETIAYSGNSGNTTGPHLHFEVRPDGDAAIDPLPWLRSHGLNPN